MTNATGVSKINIKAWASPDRLRLYSCRIRSEIFWAIRGNEYYGARLPNLRPGGIQFISRQDLQYEQRGAAFLARYLDEHPNDHVVVDSQSYANNLLELRTPHRNRVHVLEYVPTIIPLDDFSRKVSGMVL